MAITINFGGRYENDDWLTMLVTAKDDDGQSYNEIVKTAAELAEADRRQRLGLAMQHFSEAAFHISEARMILADLDLIGDITSSDLDLMVARILGLQDEHTIKRASVVAEPALPLPEGEVA